MSTAKMMLTRDRASKSSEFNIIYIMQGTISNEECFQCLSSLKPGESAKKDFPICKRCFDAMYALERSTIRKLVFAEPDHIIDNLYLGGEASAINLEYLRGNQIDRVVVAAAYADA